MVKEAANNSLGTTAASSDAVPDKTPDQLVEEQILLRLEKESLLDAEALKDIRVKLATGQLSSQEWKFAVENTLERRQRHE